MPWHISGEFAAVNDHRLTTACRGAEEQCHFDMIAGIHAEQIDKTRQGKRVRGTPYSLYTLP